MKINVFPPRAVQYGPLLAALAVFSLAPAANAALPKFAQKENKKCSFCHVKPEGGGGRNAAGRWYQTHGFSLAGFTGTKPGVAKKPAARKSVPPIKRKRSKP